MAKQEDSQEQPVTLRLVPSNRTVGSMQFEKKNDMANLRREGHDEVMSDGTINLNSF